MGTIILNGTSTSATIFTTSTDVIEDYALAQLQLLCDNETAKNCRIRVMPDVHPGKVGTIGLTMTIGEKLMPSLVGIDIGCGITTDLIQGKIRDFQKLDTVIRESIPSGFSIRKTPHRFIHDFDFQILHCYKHIQTDKAMLSAGTLGSGNHFIELGQDDSKNTFLTVHSGSRHLGKEVTEYYLNKGQQWLKAKGIFIPYELTYLEGKLLQNYLEDLLHVQAYAELNRKIILAEICKKMKWKIQESQSCIHNYIECSPRIIQQFHSPMLRKGAISAQKNEAVIIPVNMRDGILLGKGLGNPEWNCSAPHGSGRILKRQDVKNHYTLSSYRAAMKGIYSSCIRKDTLDEAPFAYRSINDISESITETVEITNILRPLYNFKAGGDQ